MWKHTPLAPTILAWSWDETTSLWHRRAGRRLCLILEGQGEKRERARDDFAFKLVDACEAVLLAAPRERFAQTGTAGDAIRVGVSRRRRSRKHAYATGTPAAVDDRGEKVARRATDEGPVDDDVNSRINIVRSNVFVQFIIAN